jgi:hypothetical protein
MRARGVNYCPCGCGQELQERNGIRYMVCVTSWRTVPAELRARYTTAKRLAVKASCARQILRGIIAARRESEAAA